MDWADSGFGSDSGDRRAQTNLSESINGIRDQSLRCEIQLAAGRACPDMTGPVTVQFIYDPAPTHLCQPWSIASFPAIF